MNDWGELYNSYIENDSREMQQRYLDNEKKRLGRAKCQRDLSSIAAFASNVLAFAGNNMGGRYNIAPKKVQAAAGLKYAAAQERYRKAMRDYQGRIARSYIGGGAVAQQGTGRVPAHLTLQKSSSATGGSLRGEDIVTKIKELKKPVWYQNNK